MANMLKFLACSDIHFHHYTNGITLDDVVKVGQEFIDKCRSYEVDAALLLGDYTVSKNPLYEVNLAISRWIVGLTKLGIPVIILLGNHDRVYKSNHKIHILEHLGLYPKDLPNIHIFDNAHTHILNINGQSVAIHGVPAGHTIPDLITYQNYDWNVGIFHGMVKGSRYQNGIVVQEGIAPQILDRSEYDIVLCGDNHAHQGFLFEHTQGLSVGAPMQHNWGDAGALRGFCLVKLIRNSFTIKDFAEHPIPYSKSVLVTQIESNAPKFIKCQARIDSLDQLLKLMETYDGKWNNSIVQLNISGPASILNSITPSEWSTKIKNRIKARVVDIDLQFDIEQSIKPISPIKTDAEEWENYLSMTNLPPNIDLDRLKKLGAKYLNDA